MDNLEYLKSKVNTISYSILENACRIIIEDSAFQKAPGSYTNHHNWPGGLLVHTAEVLKIALSIVPVMAPKGDEIDTDIIITSVIFHDYMKVRDYKTDDKGNITKTRYRELVRHVNGSHAEFVMAYYALLQLRPDLEVEQNKIDHIQHCILAHHGRQEWGSPVEPQTPEAMIIHFADMLSANYGPRKMEKLDTTNLKLYDENTMDWYDNNRQKEKSYLISEKRTKTVLEIKIYREDWYETSLGFIKDFQCNIILFKNKLYQCIGGPNDGFYLTDQESGEDYCIFNNSIGRNRNKNDPYIPKSVLIYLPNLKENE